MFDCGEKSSSQNSILLKSGNSLREAFIQEKNLSYGIFHNGHPNNKVDATKAAVRVRLALKKMIAAKKVVGAAAAGKKGAGSYKLAAVEAVKGRTE